MTELAEPVRESVPLHEYVYEPSPPEAEAVQVTLVPVETLVGDTEQEAVTGGFDTVTWVQPPQLFPSFDSVMVPVFEAELLSAQARTYQVAADGKVYESVAVVFAPEESAEALWVPISVALEPDKSVARWKTLVKP